MITYTELGGSTNIEASLCEQLEKLRLAHDLTQKELSKKSGVSVPTLGRMKQGKGISLDTFIRILMALGIVDNLAALLPDPTVRPMERNATRSGKERVRARPQKPEPTTAKAKSNWQWGDEIENDPDE